MSEHGQVSPVMHKLSTYIAGALKRKLPAAVAERAKLSLVDTFASTISGSRLIAGKRAIAYVRRLGGPREAGVIGTRVVTSMLNAALANGMCCHADESDDTHPPTCTHPNTSVIPAALAIAERQRLSGELLLRAMVLGFDICARTVLAMKVMTFMRTGHHSGSHGQLFGAAAAAGALLRLDAREMRYVLSYCAEQAAGLFTMLRDSHHIEKAYAMGGMPAHNGVAAALMVAQGFTGVEDVLSGEPNYLSIFSPDADREVLVRGLGRDYEIMRGGIKRWPVGAPVQGPLHVLHDLIRQHGLKADDVEKIVARIPDKELLMVNNREMSDISLQYLLAVMLLDGTVTLAAAHDIARMKDPTVLKLRRRIETIGDANLTDPLRRWRCVMEVTLKDGRKLAHQTMAAKGTFENPLTRQEVEEKALGLMGPVFGKQRSRALMAALYNIDGIKDVRTLRKLYMAS
ncbi:MAG: MmgE/PrpD family protein [Betaproteobacteria bacterium]|nr:MmgE/PrpD family protein [Betaproteobacteria bacterium]